MGFVGSSGHNLDTGVLTERQTKSILRTIGVPIIGSTVHDFTVLCPYHGNRNTPSMTVSKTNGKFFCFNQACGAKGNIVDLVMTATNKQYYEALRIVLGARDEQVDVTAELQSRIVQEDEWREFSLDVLKSMWEARPGSPGEQYMLGRGFTKETLDTFQIGYSPKKRMVTVPVRTPGGTCVGVIGRSIDSKEFKNSVGLPKMKLLFNMRRARIAGDTVIVTEASFDAMRVHQAGFPNVVAMIGSSISEYHVALLRRNFSRVIIMVDNDNPADYVRSPCRNCAAAGQTKCIGHSPGEAIRQSFLRLLPDMDLWYAAYSPTEIYPRGCKDSMDMTDDEIMTSIKNAIPSYEYPAFGRRALHVV